MILIVIAVKKKLTMQQPMPILPQPLMLNPLRNAAKIEAIDDTRDFENLLMRLDSIEKFIHRIRVNLKEP